MKARVITFSEMIGTDIVGLNRLGQKENNPDNDENVHHDDAARRLCVVPREHPTGEQVLYKLP